MNIDSRDLRYFEVIAELGHLRKAAEQLHLSQPALSKCIRRLESTLGAALFERAGRGIQLTAVGEELLRQARRLNAITSNALHDVKAFATGNEGVVRIGCGPVVAETLMPTICSMVTTHLPNLRLRITVGMNYFLREELAQGNIDVIFGMLPPEGSDLLSLPLIEDTVVVAASAHHPLLRQQEWRIEDLLPYQWVLPVEAVASRGWLDQQFNVRGLAKPEARIEVNATPLLLPMIAQSAFLCFVSRHMLDRQVRDPRIQEIPLVATTLHRKLGLTLAATTLTPGVHRFVDLIRKSNDLQTTIFNRN